MEAAIIKALGGRRAFGSGRIDLLAEVERGLPVRAYVALVKTLALTPAETACLKVPSAIVPEESNYLLNPRHPDFHELTVDLPKQFNFDRRLARSRRRS